METRPPRIPRGSFADRSFQRMYVERAHLIRMEGSSRQEELFHAYYRYLLTRKSRLARIACPGETASIEAYLQYAAHVLLDMMRDGGTHAGAARCPVTVGTSMGYETMYGGDPRFELGHADHGVLGSETVLGDETADMVPRLDIEWRIRLAEWDMLTRNADALVYLVDACELGMPLHFNYRISFAINPSDWIFRLLDISGSLQDVENRTLLGVNSALGAG